MKLEQLLRSIGVSDSLSRSIDINRIVFNSKEVQKNDLFVAIQGHHRDGHDFIPEAVRAGAAAIVGEQDPPPSVPVPYFRVPNARRALAVLAAERFGHPGKKHTMIGITGTNGKTTTSFMIRHILEHARQTCALSGTVECYANGASFPARMTTSDPVTLQQWIFDSRDQNVIVEVSSHGLSQKRVDGIAFDYAIFTNLSREHLDYHVSMPAYFEAKKHLFSLLSADGTAIVNTHCRWGRKLAEQLKKEGTNVFTYGADPADAIRLLAAECGARPRFIAGEQGKTYAFELKVPGSHNLWNALAAIALARSMGIGYPVLARALQTFPGVPGRFETYLHPCGALFVVDYAHTPDGLLQCLATAKRFRPQRLMHIFGFRGRRDKTKWELMLRLSRSLCDETVLTLDDLNGVPVDDMLQTYQKLGTQLFAQSPVQIIPDRTLALQRAWNQARPGDCVVITGKGHETYQQPFCLPAESDSGTLRHLLHCFSQAK